MTGQDAIKSAGEFNRRIGVTGVVLTKMDGDARGGAALSVVGVVGVPIAFVGSGERLAGSRAVPSPIASCRACSAWATCCRSSRRPKRPSIDRGRARSSKQKIRHDEFTLEDFRDQLRTIKKMGPLEQILGMLPGHGQHEGAGGEREQVDEKQLGRVEAIINSMTPKERAQSPADQRQPAQAHREGQRHVGRRGEPAAQAVRADEEDAEAAGRHGRAGGQRRRGRGADEAMMRRRAGQP